jgi:hypothetical protein
MVGGLRDPKRRRARRERRWRNKPRAVPFFGRGGLCSTACVTNFRRLVVQPRGVAPQAARPHAEAAGVKCIQQGVIVVQFNTSLLNLYAHVFVVMSPK